MDAKSQVPKALQNWFIFHFVVDILFAIPLLLVPGRFLSMLGWNTIDPVAARLVAAALFGIGIASLMSYRADFEVYREMLNLKIVWSLAAIVGLGISLVQGDQGRPFALWLLLLVFFIFNLVWVYWRFTMMNRVQQKPQI